MRSIPWARSLIAIALSVGRAFFAEGFFQAGLSGGDPALCRRQRAAAERRHGFQALALDVAERPGEALGDGEGVERGVDAGEQGALLGAGAGRAERLVRRGAVEVQ